MADRHDDIAIQTGPKGRITIDGKEIIFRRSESSTL